MKNLREDPLWKTVEAWKGYDPTFDDLANLDCYKSWVRDGKPNLWGTEEKKEKKYPGDTCKVVMSQDKFDKLSAFREWCSNEAYGTPKSVGLGSAVCIAIDILNFVRETHSEPSTPQVIEIIKKYPKHGRPKQAYTKHGGQPRVQVRKEYTQ